MPVLARFYGIIVRMAFCPTLGAHFHATCEDTGIVVGLNPLRIVQGDAPERVRQLVLDWARAHHAELIEAWHRCGAALPIQPIAPLA